MSTEHHRPHRPDWASLAAGCAMAGVTVAAWYLLLQQTSTHQDRTATVASMLVLTFGLALSLLIGWIVHTNRELRRQSVELRHGERRLASLLDNLPGMVFRWRNLEDWPAEFLSEGCEPLVGYPREDFETQKRSWKDLIHPDDREVVRQAVDAAALAGEPFNVEYRIETRNGQQKWVRSRGRVVDDQGPEPGWLEGLVIDISAQKSSADAREDAEREATRLREDLAGVDRLTMLGEMATGIAHEINQPLSAISMYAQTGIRLLAKSPLDADKLASVLAKTSTQAHRAAGIIERMQLLGSDPDADFVNVDCNPLIAEVGMLAETEARLRGMDIAIRLGAGPCTCTCIPIQIQQVALNLLRNAIAAMARKEGQTDNVVRLDTQLSQGRFVVSVTDSGTGVSDETVDAVFQPFSSDRKAGLGLGLSICMGIIRAHRGDMGFHNNDSGGATFYFALPCTTGEAS